MKRVTKNGKLFRKTNKQEKRNMVCPECGHKHNPSIAYGERRSFFKVEKYKEYICFKCKCHWEVLK